ncbi:armadillo-type protein, partial [Dissophora ornata]
QRSVLRFLLQPLNKGFQDKNAHVRKTAAMACISLFELDPVFVLESEIVDKLYGMLRDRDAQVVVNTILALENILADEGGIVINQSIAAHLIKRYKDWNPGQLQVILGVLCRYKPQTNDEIYEIMNDVDDGLQHPSLAVQMATLRLFIWLCQDLNEIQEDVQKTIEETLIKHLDSPVQDLVHASLCHLSLMIETTGKLQHNTTQTLSALFCRPGDPVPIRLQKLALCAMVAQQPSATATSISFILDYLCQVASMKDVALLQKSSRGTQKLDRHSIAAHLEVVCRAIEAIATIGSHQSARHGQQEIQQMDEQQQKHGGSIIKSCLDRLFQLLILFANLEQVLEERQERKEGTGSSKKGKKVAPGQTESWMHKDMADLNLDDSQAALLLSTALMAIERSWQSEFNARQHAYEQTTATGGIFAAFQIKALGTLLLRHLDQGELDRLAKKKKPLRFRYDDNSNGEDSASISSSTHLHQGEQRQYQQQPGEISRLSRISGIRMLLLEESAQQFILREELVEDGSDQAADAERKNRLQIIQFTLKMRAQYALLLQQQVQDMVQSIDTHIATTATSTIRRSDIAYMKARAEQIAVLHLACHLVAFSIEHGQGGTDADLQQDNELLSRRLDILAQAVDQLIPGPGSKFPQYENDLLTKDGSPVDDILVEGEHGGNEERRVESVSRDVADRARLIEALFLVPIANAVLSRPSSRTVSNTNQFDSPVFKTKAYQHLLKQKFVSQFGIRGKNRGAAAEDTKVLDTPRNHDSTSVLQDMDRLARLDWLFQVGFNTLAVAM